MKVLLLNDGGYGDVENVEFPVEVEALRLTGGGYFKISKDELHRVGFVGFDNRKEWNFRDGVGAVLAPTPNEAPRIRDMCCNQFGERDEMQSIINALQADVIARDECIKELKQDINELREDKGWDFKYPDVGVSYE